MDIKQIEELLVTMEKRGLRRLRLKQEKGFEIELEREPAILASSVESIVPRQSMVQPIQQSHIVEESKKKESVGKVIHAPLVGTFYSAPSPAEPLFVKIGDQVEEETVVCIIEAMKVMNEIKAGVRGKISEILVENAQPVEFGTPLFRVV